MPVQAMVVPIQRWLRGRRTAPCQRKRLSWVSNFARAALMRPLWMGWAWMRLGIQGWGMPQASWAPRAMSPIPPTGAFGFEDGGIEFRTGKERQDDCTRASQESDPLRIPCQAALRKTEEPGKEHANDQLGHRADHNLRKRRRDFEPDRQQRRCQRKPHPERTKSPSVRHEI